MELPESRGGMVLVCVVCTSGAGYKVKIRASDSDAAQLRARSSGWVEPLAFGGICGYARKQSMWQSNARLQRIRECKWSSIAKV